MEFNSLIFAVFFIAVFLLYWHPLNEKVISKNKLLLFSSYFFYSCWDWRFLFLLLFSTNLDYFCGIRIGKEIDKHKKRIWLCLCIIINLGILAVLKYYNFFISSFNDLLLFFHFQSDYEIVKLVLPVGISFYTFHGLSYVIDIYYSRIKPEKSIIDYSLFVSFFPLLVAGPIERATHLLPQIKENRIFSPILATQGLRHILWGLFKKVVIADNCAEYVNVIFENYDDFSGFTLLLGALLFSVQIYADFSGYSDIAVGLAKLFGIHLLRNFSFPYFSRNVAEFWRRWHISLSSWFKDYLYIPLGGSRHGKSSQIKNTLIIFIVSGLWHGANWTFVFWGFLNALFILPSIISKKNRVYLDIVASGKVFPTLKESFNILMTFLQVSLTWVYFRCDSIGDANGYLSKIFSESILTYTEFPGLNKFLIFSYLLFFFVFEWIGRDTECPINVLTKLNNRWISWTFYYFLILSIIFIEGGKQTFIYFQF